MNRKLAALFLAPVALTILSADDCGGDKTRSAEKAVVDRQQEIYSTGQALPLYDSSLERERIIGLYNARMSTGTQTWAVWRGATSVIEGDCPSSGYSLPYGVQLTSPEVIAWSSNQGGVGVLPQAEPNGLFTNGITSNATWVFCITDGQITPIEVEATVTTYPYPVRVDYEKNRVYRDGDPTVTLKK